LPARLVGYVDMGALRTSHPTDTLPLDDGEELLLAIDAVLGDGSGRVLEGAALELGARMLAQGVGGVVAGDLLATVARMRGLIERPYLGVDVSFQLTTTDTGFALSLGVAGRPRSARLLRHLAAGAIRAAQRFSRGADEDSLKLYAETIGDRCSLSARYREPRSSESDASPARTRRPSRSFRVGPQTNLSEQVERILNRSTTEPPAGLRRTSNPPPGMTHSSPPPPPLAERSSRSERPPAQRDGSLTLPPSPRLPSVTLRENDQGEMEEVAPSDRPTPVGKVGAGAPTDNATGAPTDNATGAPTNNTTVVTGDDPPADNRRKGS
jgi:hypothetical protein